MMKSTGRASAGTTPETVSYKPRFSGLAIALACGTLLLPGTSLGQTAPSSNDEAEVRQLEREWLDAYEQRDAASMDAVLHDTFEITFENGETLDKEGVLQSLTSPDAINTRFETSNVRSNAYPGVVVLRGTVTTRYHRGDGSSASYSNSYTDTYVRSQGRWRVAASHLSRAPGGS